MDAVKLLMDDIMAGVASRMIAERPERRARRILLQQCKTAVGYQRNLVEASGGTFRSRIRFTAEGVDVNYTMMLPDQPVDFVVINVGPL